MLHKRKIKKWALEGFVVLEGIPDNDTDFYHQNGFVHEQFIGDENIGEICIYLGYEKDFCIIELWSWKTFIVSFACYDDKEKMECLLELSKLWEFLVKDTCRVPGEDYISRVKIVSED